MIDLSGNTWLKQCALLFIVEIKGVILGYKQIRKSFSSFDIPNRLKVETKAIHEKQKTVL